MEWLQRLNAAVGYLEENLDESIDYGAAAQIACCSTYHFQRMFSYIAGIPLSEYIRRRRMTLAAFELQNGGKVVDVALRFGYDSPTAFNRAFQSVHGVSPRAAKAQGISLKAYGRIVFSISIKGEAEMNYRIEKKEAFRIVGAKQRMELQVEENFKKAPQFWMEQTRQGLIPRLCAVMNQEPFGVMGVSTCDAGKDLDYYIAVSSTAPLPEGLSEYIVPAQTWAIFECIGPMPQAMQQMMRRIVSEWLPTSGYEYADAPDIELYTDGDQTAPDYRSEIWMPIIKKKEK